MSTVYCFGDSNGAGADLNPGEKPFIHWFSKELGLGYQNYSENGASLGIIQHRLIINHKKITKDDIVLIVIPPDTRWYDQNKKAGFYSLVNYDIEDYYTKFLNKKTLEWFEYHHTLFTYTIQQILNNIGCYYIMFLSAGRLGGSHYELDIDYNTFLSNEDMLNFLSKEKVIWDNYPHHLQPEEHQFMYNGAPWGSWDLTSPLIGSDGDPTEKGGHPTELGHKYISNMLLEKYYNDKK